MVLLLLVPYSTESGVADPDPYFSELSDNFLGEKYYIYEWMD